MKRQAVKTDDGQVWVIYRVSTGRQAGEDHHSLTRQEQTAEQAAQALGARITRVFRYEGASAFEKTSVLKVWAPITEALRALPANKRPSKIIVAHEDRAFRNHPVYSMVTDDLMSLGVWWVPANDPHSDPTSLITIIKIGVAQEESRATSRRVKGAQAVAIAKGQYTHKPLYGYIDDQAEPGVPKHHPEHGQRQRRALKAIAAGSTARAAWSREGITVTYNHWVSRVCSPFYAGIHPTTGEIAKWPPLITLDEHRAILRAMGKTDPTASTPRAPTRRPEFPLKALVYCPCGRKLTAFYASGNGGKYPWYRCSRSKPQGRTTACVKGVRAETLHAMWLDIIGRVRWLVEPETFRAEIAADWAEANRQAVERRVQLRHDRTRLDAEADIHTKALSRERNERIRERTRRLIESIDARLSEIDVELGTLDDDDTMRADAAQALHLVTALLRDPVGLWNAGDLDDQIAVGRAIFPNGVTFDGEKVQTTAIAPIFELISMDRVIKTTDSKVWYARQGSNLRPPA